MIFAAVHLRKRVPRDCPKSVLNAASLCAQKGVFTYENAVMRPAGVEPTAFGSGGQRSIQLSYGRGGERELATDSAGFHR
jgi:hypothetical protein